MHPLIGLIGKKRSGKDSFAATLTGQRGFTRFAFADPLKYAVLRVDPAIGCFEDGTPIRLSEHIAAVGWEQAKETREVRRLLQEYGVAIREIDEDFWVRATLDRALDHAALRGPVVITDVRFPNEARAIRDAGGSIVRISRPGLVSDDTHVSETALDDYEADATVVNDGSLDDLAFYARSLI